MKHLLYLLLPFLPKCTLNFRPWFEVHTSSTRFLGRFISSNVTRKVIFLCHVSLLSHGGCHLVKSRDMLSENVAAAIFFLTDYLILTMKLVSKYVIKIFSILTDLKFIFFKYCIKIVLLLRILFHGTQFSIMATRHGNVIWRIIKFRNRFAELVISEKFCWYLSYFIVFEMFQRNLSMVHVK